MSNYGCQQILISPDPDLKAILEFLCQESNKLANCGIYYSRQLYFKTGRIPHKYELHNFVQIPTARLKDRIAQLCTQYGIRFVETEESYTSKASFLDSDLLPTFGEKPEGWQPSGKRVKRGLYRSMNGTKINADANGCANILRKVAATLGINLDGVSSGALKTPLRVCLWTVQESPVLANQSASRLEA
jgi:hypothetical protein